MSDKTLKVDNFQKILAKEIKKLSLRNGTTSFTL